MIRRLPVVLAVVLISSAVAQNRATITSRFGSSSGFGSVLFPGTGHAPAVRLPGNITDPGFAGRLGSSVRGYPGNRGFSGGYGITGRGMRNAYPVVLPVPVYVGGDYYPYDPAAAGYYQQPVPVIQQQQPAAPPVVIINQGYQPQTANPVVRTYPEGESAQGMSSYQAPVHPMPDPSEAREEPRPVRRVQVEDDKPTIYLIAFKDHTILPALAYWMEGDTLNYITTQGTPNRASIGLIDREFSRQLNRERQVEFSLP